MPSRFGRILIIDDDEGILTTLRILLRKHFFEVVTESTPQKITHLLNQKHFQVILLDMNFSIGATSGKEGFQWLRTIRQVSPESSVVLMTAYGDIDLAIQAMKDGATDFITKPWDNEKLLDTLASAYKQSKIQNALEPVDFSQDLIAEEVSRVFMFLDIKSSTEIAERLGHVKYFSLLNDFFGDISDSIVSHAGEIYQYVGDEVVISWPLEDGLSQANCLNCFFSIVDKMKLLSSSYQEKYQLNPEFKAGLHCGKVTSGMVGTVKKELVFSGEVLNTTSRIEGMCNRYQVNLLVSQSLLDQLPQGMHFTSQEIGEINLRGKQQPMTLFHVQRARRGVS